MPDAKGIIVGEVRNASETVLVDIAKRCFDKDIFKSQQTKRMIEFIKDELGIEPEYLWKNILDYAVFRVANNQK